MIAVDPGFQINPIPKFHHHIVKFIFLTGVINLNNIFVTPTGHRPPLPQKAGGVFGVLAEGRGYDLNGNRPFQDNIPAAVDLGHPTPAEKFFHYEIR
jgi:hypothetical protein